jgi:hypothetical protein
MFLCKFPNLPLIPSELLAGVDADTPGKLLRDYKGWTHTKDGKEIKSSDNPFFYASVELEEWIKENICKQFNDVGIRFAYGKLDINTAGVHTDQTRKYVLQYMIKTGGGNLNFWQQDNEPIQRSGRHTLNSYDDLTLLSTFETPENTWIMLNAQVLHSVENLNSTRINVQVSLNYDPFE